MLYLFLYSFFISQVVVLFFPYTHLLGFAPFLILCFYKNSLISCLWLSLLCGLVIDLFSSEMRLGMNAFNYCLTTYCLYRFQFYFFEDRYSSLPIMTGCYTCLSTIIQVVLLKLNDQTISLSWEWAFDAMLLTPMQGALYAAIAFSLPSMLFSKSGLLSRLKRKILKRNTSS